MEVFASSRMKKSMVDRVSRFVITRILVDRVGWEEGVIITMS